MYPEMQVSKGKIMFSSMYSLALSLQKGVCATNRKREILEVEKVYIT